MIDLICKNCNKTFQAPNWKQDKKFCSIDCYKKHPNISNYNKNRKDKSYEQLYGEEKSIEIKKRIVISVAKAIKKHTKEKKEEIKKKKSISAKKSGAGGYKPGSGKGIKVKFTSKYHGEIILDSSYEYSYVKYLEEKEIYWERNKEKFPYYHNNRKRNYIPDFYIPGEDLFIETKGFQRYNDQSKWNYFPHKLKILFKQDLIDLGIDLKNILKEIIEKGLSRKKMKHKGCKVSEKYFIDGSYKCPHCHFTGSKKSLGSHIGKKHKLGI